MKRDFISVTGQHLRLPLFGSFPWVCTSGYQKEEISVAEDKKLTDNILWTLT